MAAFQDVFGLLKQATAGNVQENIRDITSHRSEYRPSSIVVDLEPGELLVHDDFTLFQALTALEMLDPRMDTGAVQLEKQTILTFAQAAGVGGQSRLFLCSSVTVPSQRGLELTAFTAQQVAFLMTHLMKQLVLWLRGSASTAGIICIAFNVPIVFRQHIGGDIVHVCLSPQRQRCRASTAQGSSSCSHRSRLATQSIVATGVLDQPSQDRRSAS